MLECSNYESFDSSRSVTRRDASKQALPEARGDRTVSRLELACLRRLLSVAGDPPVDAVLWDSSYIAAPSGPPVARVSIRDRQTFWKVVLDPLYQFGEAYASGRLEVEGDLTAVLSTVFRSLDGARAQRPFRRWLHGWFHRPRRTTRSASRDNIHHHYDVGNDFYRLWLDDEMVYTCAYFPDATATLESAQVAKLEHVCRKLRLKPGETVLEAGCGWGSLALYMARHYDVKVCAFNISRAQLEYARERARREGLAGQVEFVEDDWRSMNQPCDVFVSVGMLEHVGPANYRRLGGVIHRCLKPHGRGLIHSIGQNRSQRLNPWIERRIFPGASAPTLREMMAVFEPYDFSVLDIENLRLHYALTLRHWLARYERAVDEVRRMYDERFVRTWRLYLAGSIAGFECGSIQLYQVAFARARSNNIPWTRAHLYTEADRWQPESRGDPWCECV